MTSLLQTIYDEIQIKKDQNSITDDDEEDELGKSSGREAKQK